MEIIKFRAVSKETNKIYYLDTKYNDDPDTTYNGADLILDILDEMWGGSSFGIKERYILEQYIGSKDKNGKEIYAGDIVKTDEAGWIAQVVYDRDCFYCVALENKGFGYSIQCNWEKFEVIGNIHEKEKENEKN